MKSSMQVVEEIIPPSTTNLIFERCLYQPCPDLPCIGTCYIDMETFTILECFQGKDPATDLRGVGVLALVNAMALLTTSEQLCKLGRNVYQLSLSKSQHFPFMVLSINVTRIALLVLKAGKLNRYVVQVHDSF